MKVIRASINDLESCAHLLHVWSYADENYLPLNDVESHVKEHYENGVVLMCLKEGSICGIMTGQVVDHLLVPCQIAKDSWFLVKPYERGSGIADALEKAFRQWAKEVGCSHVMISVDTWTCKDVDRMKKALDNRDYQEFGYVYMRGL